MKIKQIMLENIRTHNKSEINLNKGITVITGRTGSGKSSFLMAIEYALFGSDSGVSNSALLKRNKQKGSVMLEFEEAGHEYSITRGLKRSGKNINVDVDRMSVSMDGKQISLLGRATDLNQKILEILNYPLDMKAKELFEVTSYTRQDEIRSLIELGPEKRQAYIDKILQLAKYKQTWENMTAVLNFFSEKLEIQKVKLENKSKLQNEIVQLQKKIEENKARLMQNSLRLTELEKEHLNISNKTAELEKKYKESLELRRSYDSVNGSINRIKTELKNSEQQLNSFKTKKQELEKKVKEGGAAGSYEELQMKYTEAVSSFRIASQEFEKISSEMEQIKKLGKGKCPTCRQEVTSAHLSSLDSEFRKKLSETSEKIEELQKKRDALEPKLRTAKDAEVFKNELKRVCDNLEHYNSAFKNYEKELESNMKKLTMITVDSKHLEKTEADLNASRKVESKIFSEMREINGVNEVLDTTIKDSTAEFKEKQNELEKMEKGQQRIEKLKQTYDLLNRLREDIRNIREIVRRNFLEDFRKEFQKKFEEIRRYEEEYVVDIKPDYEPVAYTSSGEEVPVSNLSGGEKTSVALSYRLALAALAAQVSSVRPSEILILDEPTTGFDQEDIKALPDALRNIQTIPQILIVTHEGTLKDAADYKFEVIKEKGESKVSEI